MEISTLVDTERQGTPNDLFGPIRLGGTPRLRMTLYYGGTLREEELRCTTSCSLTLYFIISGIQRRKDTSFHATIEDLSTAGGLEAGAYRRDGKLRFLHEGLAALGSK